MLNRLIALPALLLLGSANPVPLPTWMAGCWTETQGERWAEECWTNARGGVMLGSARTGTGARLTNWETMQIMPGDASGEWTGATPKLVLWVSPQGGSRVAFAWSPKPGAGMTFFNVAHDYPQRISYRREGALLLADIAMADGSRVIRWRYRRA